MLAERSKSRGAERPMAGNSSSAARLQALKAEFLAGKTSSGPGSPRAASGSYAGSAAKTSHSEKGGILASGNGHLPAVKTGAVDLCWQGEYPKRFCMLRGSKLVKENDITSIYSIFTEVQALGFGTITIDAFKTYISRMGQGNMVVFRLASSICAAMGKRDRSKPITFTDMLGVVFQKAAKEELEFLQVSAEEFKKELVPGSDSSGVRTRPLSLAEMRLAREIYARLDKNDSGYVSLSALIMSMVNSFPDTVQEDKVHKQLQRVIPKSFRAIDPESFLKFLTVHLCYEPCIDLSKWSALLHGHNIVMSRYVHREENLTDTELALELKAKPDTSINRLMNFARRRRSTSAPPERASDN